MTESLDPAEAVTNPGTDATTTVSTPPPTGLDLLVQPLEPSRAGTLLIVAAAFGLLGNLLIYPQYLGAGATVWALAVLMALAWLSRRHAPEIQAAGGEARSVATPAFTRGLYALAVLAALCFSWRDAPALRCGSVALYFLAVIAIQLNACGVPLRQSPLLVALLHMLYTAYAWLVLPVFQIQCWRRAASLRPRTPFSGTLRGTVIAFLLLLVFGSLLGKADVRFSALMLGFLPENAAAFLGDVFWVLLFACAALAIITNRPRAHPALPQGGPETVARNLDENGLTLARLDLLIPMVALDILFAVFVYLQLGYFFGGEAYVQATAGVTYAEYARRGFFELLTVAALVLPLQLLFDWWLRKEPGSARTLFHRLAMLQGVLLLFILASAAHRMALYQQAYGLTQLRVYASAGILWIGGTIIWQAATVLRGRRDRFFFGAAAGSVAFFFALALLNPDALVARVNTQIAGPVPMVAPGEDIIHRRTRRGGVGVDAAYLTTLSADAVPALHAALPHLNEHGHNIVAAHLRRIAESKAMADWRAWSWSRWRASRALSGMLGRVGA